MSAGLEQLDAVPGFSVPVHRALTEPILLGGAPRSVAILNGTLAGAVGLGLQLWSAYVTATITVWDENARVADEKLRLVEKIVQGRDFTAMIETINAVDAWLGSGRAPDP
ncbi:VirB3 family type IV secretion system protein [Paracoccus sp. pheM1]|uniref:VirB3 family type IV secretion system protein n=1 Tax=Paracoccus sp. pheM1 TaxID=2831675 RepID=UPI001F0B1B32|nr:VirB3 family type IV secretion system protein [Paracoccus sp. pheM1]